MRIGIIGAGRMGHAHSKSIAAYGATVAAVHDINLEAAQKLAEEAGAACATDELTHFFDQELDGVVIATPPPARVEPVTRACARGIHLMIEKPPALTMADGRNCLEQIEHTQVIAAVGFQLRYAPLYERLRERLAGQTVHLVRTACTVDYYLRFQMAPWFLQKSASGGPIAEQAIHLLDCVRFVLGDPKATKAIALGTKNMAPDHTELDAENAIQMSYALDNGVFGTHMNHCGTERFAFDLEVVGPHLRLHANLAEGRVRGYLHGKDIDEPAPAENALRLDKTGAWLRAIETGDRSLVRSDFRNALNTLALVEAATKSLTADRFLSVSEV